MQVEYPDTVERAYGRRVPMFVGVCPVERCSFSIRSFDDGEIDRCLRSHLSEKHGRGDESVDEMIQVL